MLQNNLLPLGIGGHSSTVRENTLDFLPSQEKYCSVRLTIFLRIYAVNDVIGVVMSHGSGTFFSKK